MRLNSIRTKVLAGVTACFLLGLMAIVLILHVTFVRNSEALAQESVRTAQKLFDILEARELSKLQAVGDTLMANREVSEALATQKRDRLLELTMPLYKQLREQGITNWLFHAPEKQKTVFLRLHNPGKFGDSLNRFMYDKAVRTHAVVTGNELAKAGFAVRVMRPYFDSRQQVIGYLELGEEISRFMKEMKNQTGDDYGLLLKKAYLDRQFWADSAVVLKQRDNWDDNPDVVVADKTTSDEKILEFRGDVTKVSNAGEVLERFDDGNSVRLRGIFPVRDASNKNVGAMFVVHDITAMSQNLRRTQNMLLLVILAVLVLTAACLLRLMTGLVFRRLDHIIAVATRVVGGDFETKIDVRSNDEIGQFENLFEQFRCVFVDLLSQMREFQEK